MSHSGLRWYPVGRGELPDHCFGTADKRGEGFLTPAAALAQGAEVAAGYAGTDLLNYDPPAVFVVSESTGADTLAWLKVFAPEASPMSQFARVVSTADWNAWQDAPSARQAQSDVWACIVLGEMLAYNAPEASILSTPLSRHVACWSNAAARSVLIHGDLAARRECIDRLVTIERDSRFAHRELSVADLLPVWALAVSGVTYRDSSASASDIVRQVLSALEEHENLHQGAEGTNVRIDDFPDFFGESIERRVLAYQQLLARIRQQEERGVSYSAVWHSALIGAGAYLVGRGTGHLFLTKKSPRAVTAVVWFALLAAFHGPKGWDADWSRLAKGVERQIRTSFSWDEPGTADLAWMEYAFTSAGAAKHAFGDLARLTARTLTIEVVPGALCQMRIVGDHAKLESSVPTSSPRAVVPQPAPVLPPSEASHEFRTALQQFVSLALDVQALLVGKAPEQKPRQKDFAFEQENGPERPKLKPKPRAKKIKPPPKRD